LRNLQGAVEIWIAITGWGKRGKKDNGEGRRGKKRGAAPGAEAEKKEMGLAPSHLRLL